MADPTGPTDPFDDLRMPVTPLAPRAGFVRELRGRVEAALRSDPDPTTTTSAPQEAVMTDTTSTTLATAGEAAASPLTPYLAVAGAAEAIDWYVDVFGAIETLRYTGDDGRVGHAELSIGGAHVMLSDEHPEIDVVGPATLGNTSVALHLEVVDVDYTYERAVSSGATSLREPGDQPHGNRNATVRDPFGHRWMISQPISAERAAVAGGGTADAPGSEGAYAITGRKPVEPGYLAFASPDVARSRAFYSALFDWEIVDGDMPGGAHIANTRFPMGFAPSDAETDGGTSVYFRVDELEPYLTRVRELGGEVVSVDDWASGGGASCRDDQGRRFDLFRPNPGY